MDKRGYVQLELTVLYDVVENRFEITFVGLSAAMRLEDNSPKTVHPYLHK